MSRSVADRITQNDLTLAASRSGGPGGQNVNKVNTRVTLYFDLENCAGFTASEKQRIFTRLQSRCDKAGVLRVVSQKYRTQAANRQCAWHRLIELIEAALVQPKPRIATHPTRGSKQKRLEHKSQRSQLKRQRSYRDWED